jgi:alkanesulfonate monooxygenase SsuD/methylene tetrahydromethanopterin reductase-like flavin-dependent oxidoreductase (luciferase family)
MAESLPTPVRIRARDLRGLARAADAARADKPGAATVVEIDAVIAPRASEAIERWTRGGSTYTDGSLPYVGTPLGLAGLIKDLWVLGIVDGALITTSSARELELVRHSVLPQFTQHAATA